MRLHQRTISTFFYRMIKRYRFTNLRLLFLKPKTRPITTPDTTRADTATRITVTSRRLNVNRKMT
jgi:hypothetical protein